jgi:hypothetical protein
MTPKTQIEFLFFVNENENINFYMLMQIFMRIGL